MDGQDRRTLIIETLQRAEGPISGEKLATQFGISRQVVVQDVAILRAEGYDILATARGYVVGEGSAFSMVVIVKHTKGQLEDELCTIVDNGGSVRDVIVTHPIYGELKGNLMLKSRKDIYAFLQKVVKENAPPLSSLTEGVHMHTIEASSDEDLQYIRKVLKQKGYLIE